MKESIVIENFGPIRKTVIEDIKPLTTFIGKSASGKSTLMKVISLFRFIYKLTNIRSYLHSSRISRSPFRIEFNSIVKELSGMITASTRVVYSVTFDDRRYDIEYSNRKLKKLPQIAVQDQIFQKGAFISENRNVISSWLSKGKDRRIGLGFYFDETLNLFIESTEAIPEADLDFIDMKLKVSKGKNNVMQYQLIPNEKTDNNVVVSLGLASSGIKTTTPLAVITEYLVNKFSFKDAFRRSVLDYILRNDDNLMKFTPTKQLVDMSKYVDIHIEEPELSLDPDSQLRLMNYLVDRVFHSASDDRLSSLMLATHSPYIVNYLNVLMALNDKEPDKGINSNDVAVYLIEDGELCDCMRYDEEGRGVVDSEYLSQQMENMYEEYDRLRDYEY